MAYKDRSHPPTQPDLNTPVSFDAVARLPQSGDNVAIATRRLAAGLTIEHNGAQFRLDTTILVGHRFAVEPIAEGQPLLSWSLPFGMATRPIAPGQYVCNAGMIEALNGRALDFTIPQRPNFQDRIIVYEVDEATFRPGRQVERYNEERTFQGFRRGGGRGVGTRNMIVVMGTTSSTAGFARSLAQALQPAAAAFPGFDGIVAIAHTEGSGYERLNNREFVLRTLAGLIVHPNVGAVLAVDAPETHRPPTRLSATPSWRPICARITIPWRKCRIASSRCPGIGRPTWRERPQLSSVGCRRSRPCPARRNRWPI